MRRHTALLVSVALIISLCASCSADKSNNKSEIDFNEAVIAVQSGTLGVDAASVYKEVGATVEEYAAFSDALLALNGKKADFAVTDEFTAAKACSADSAVECVGKSSFSLEYCAVFFENEQLTEDFNNIIAELNESGKIAEIKKAYLDGGVYSVNETQSPTKGELIMLTDDTLEPFEYSNSDGDIIGIDIDIARLICNSLGYSLKVRYAAVDKAFLLLSEGKADFIMSGITYTEERAEVYSFSRPYVSLNFDIIALK